MVSIDALAERLGVSEMTIRRDLDKLQADGQVRRVHGGAEPAERMIFEFDFVARRQANRQAKRSIAAAARSLIEPGQRIIIDTGTTTLELARLLRDAEDLTVLTPSLAVASELQFSQGVRTILLGGQIRRGTPDLTGMVAEAVLDMFAADWAFQGADGIDLDGAMYTADLQIAKVDQKIRQRAGRTAILADGSKIGRTALTRHGYLQQCFALYTDPSIHPDHRAALRQIGAEVVIAPTHSSPTPTPNMENAS
jgi:DeoR/GlpR family transcriptional regulator of sugar metabolism